MIDSAGSAQPVTAEELQYTSILVDIQTARHPASRLYRRTSKVSITIYMAALGWPPSQSYSLRTSWRPSSCAPCRGSALSALTRHPCGGMTFSGIHSSCIAFHSLGHIFLRKVSAIRPRPLLAREPRPVPPCAVCEMNMTGERLTSPRDVRLLIGWKFNTVNPEIFACALISRFLHFWKKREFMKRQNKSQHTVNLKSPVDYPCFWIRGVDTVYACVTSAFIVYIVLPVQVDSSSLQY